MCHNMHKLALISPVVDMDSLSLFIYVHDDVADEDRS